MVAMPAQFQSARRDPIEYVAAGGIAVEAIALAAWSVTVLMDGLEGQSTVTRDGSETVLGAFMLGVAVLIGVLSWALFKGYRWPSGPAITIQVLLIGGAVVSNDFLSIPIMAGIIALALVVGVCLLVYRNARYESRG